MLEQYGHDDLTTVSFSGEAPLPPDRRKHIRHVSVLRVAKLRTPHGEELCLVRNISAGGLMAHVYSPLAVGDAVSAEFREEQVITGRILWRRPGLAGLKFDSVVDAAALLSGDQHNGEAHHARAPRVNLAIRARLRAGARYHSAIVRNISQGGARLELPEPLPVGQKIVLTIAGLPAVTGLIRWADGSDVGASFDAPLPLDVLGQWVVEVQRRTHGNAGDGPVLYGETRHEDIFPDGAAG